MRKIFALYRNEMVKTSHKVSIIIIAALMVVCVFGVAVILKFSMSSESANYTADTQWQQQQKEQYENEIAALKAQLAQNQDDYDLKTQLFYVETDLDAINMAISAGIGYPGGDYSMQSQILSSWCEAENTRKELIERGRMGEQGLEQRVSAYTEISGKLKNLFQDPDYKEYIALSNQLIELNEYMSSDEKKIQIESNALRLSANPNGENISGLETEIMNIETAKKRLLSNINEDGAVMSAEERAKVEDDLAVSTYRLENALYSGGTVPSMAAMITVGMLFIMLLTIILAGGSISQEMSTGSIKSLIISPVKRWKIFTAKLLSLISVGVLASLLLYVSAVAANLIFFGTENMAPYIYVSGGAAHELNFFLYYLAFIGVNFIDVVVFLVFAFMMSVITRNSAASVGIAMAVYFGGGMVTQIITSLTTGEWLRFIPFCNLSLAGKFFPFSPDAEMVNMFANMVSNSNTLQFSLIYLAVLVFLMGYTAFDSFTRRDIK